VLPLTNPKSAAGPFDTRSTATDADPRRSGVWSASWAPAITSPDGALLGLQNWKRSTGWRTAIVEIGRPKMRVHGLRHTYASLARRAGADLRLLQKTMGHASITVTAHVYADLYDDELDVVVSALDALDDRPSE
jgi:integrase